jgi:hypothetical protein
MNDVWGSGPDHIFAAGGPSVFFSDGSGSWKAQLTVTGDVVKAVWVASRDAVYACTQRGMVFRSNGAGTWSEAKPINGTGVARACYSIWGSGPDDVYLGTVNGVYHGAP